MSDNVFIMSCSHPGCNELRATAGINKYGKTILRKKCKKHYNIELAEKRGFSDINEYQKDCIEKLAKAKGFSSVSEYKRHSLEELAKAKGFSSANEYKQYSLTELAKKKGFSSANEYRYHSLLELARKKGFSSIQEYRNSIHPYKRWKKDYCENLDGRLGYVCTSTIKISTQLELDHIDGNPSNNVYENFQTLCSCCHVYKTIINEDHKSPGRTLLEIRYR